MALPSKYTRSGQVPSSIEATKFIVRKLVLAFISFAVVLGLLYLYFGRQTWHADINTESALPGSLVTDAGSWPSEKHPHSPDNLAYVNAQKKFWSPWARAIRRAKPMLGDIRLNVKYNNTLVDASQAREPRTPVINCTYLSDTDLGNLTEAHQSFRKTLKASTRFDQALEPFYRDRGVVIVAGGEYFGPAIVSIQMLRSLGSDLPVEVFLLNWNEYEPEVCEEYLPNLNAHCRVLEDVLSDNDSKYLKPRINRFQLKSLAILFSSFRAALLIDCDVIPLVDPVQLFDHPAFTSTGFLSWPDVWASSESPDFYTAVGLAEFPAGLPPSSSEAAQILVDKKRHIRTLLLAAYYNIWGPAYFFPLLNQDVPDRGDKNAFEAAAIVLDAPYYRVPQIAKQVGRTLHEELKTSGLVQFMPEEGGGAGEGGRSTVQERPKSDKAAFLHAYAPKMNAGILTAESNEEGVEERKMRLWGTKEQQVQLFGKDLEKEVWGIVKDTGCQLADSIKYWRGHKDMCQMLERHLNEVFT